MNIWSLRCDDIIKAVAIDTMIPDISRIDWIQCSYISKLPTPGRSMWLLNSSGKTLFSLLGDADEQVQTLQSLWN